MRALHDVPAPAKLNVFLHVVGRRADGYHLIQSVFMLIDWADTLHFERRADGRLNRHDLGLTVPEDDLCLRAARALQSASGSPFGVDISLQKSIPAQAGMGGGSSDAATCLLALNRLWDLNWSRQRLARIGLGLGADVPFFLFGHHAWVEGIGERMQAVDLPLARFAVLKPAAGLETASIFRHAMLRRDSEPATIAGFAAGQAEESVGFEGSPLGGQASRNVFSFGRNDLQPVAAALCPEVDHSLEWLRQHGLRPRMTGSGSAVFAQLPDLGAGFEASPPSGSTLRVCSNLEVHPLLGWAPSDDSSVGR